MEMECSQDGTFMDRWSFFFRTLGYTELSQNHTPNSPLRGKCQLGNWTYVYFVFLFSTGIVSPHVVISLSTQIVCLLASTILDINHVK